MCKEQTYDKYNIKIDNNIIEESEEKEDDSIFNIFTPDEILLACQSCYLPITKKGLIIDEIISTIQTAVVIERANLLTEYIREDSVNGNENQWCREVFCFQCGLKLSFGSENATTAIKSYKSNENVGILNTKFLKCGPASELKTHYDEI